MIVGEIKEIIRHPVKSMRGENVQTTTIERYGVYGDRSHAYLDKTKPGKFITASQFSAMVGYAPAFKGEETERIFPQVEVKTPEGKVYLWNDSELLQEIEKESGRKIETIQYEADCVQMGGIWEEHILLVTEPSLQKLASMWGEEIDHRRFRANLVLSLYEDSPFLEETWFGKRLQFGEAVLQIQGYCERCDMINIDPDTYSLDRSLLKTVARKRSNNFGVYASVVQTGKIKVGDQVRVLE
ncbi:MOSC domain-containing protein [Bacillus sp. 165]|uniref:MOSC domain-containing protein n=1 Tax=Bacillus sp. 165 TaxID=1529117 RepID=UPI001AD958E2|nr:MOSC domain-containing protein [Bacillus sp. 165]MBO9128607.1 MOSC domain-containing protein [Bacillus sp. 165]